jgi:hypothetical protein
VGGKWLRDWITDTEEGLEIEEGVEYNDGEGAAVARR